ncbi:MAG TPA: ATP-binding protein [Anaerolineae bacterium]|nr:ATP-binding protein [Anaerolineae bacterium]
MTTLYVLIGLPGSGKSTWARQNVDRLHAVVVGSDEVRREFQANGQNPLNGDRVFAEVERRARSLLQADQSVILDATHFLRKYRTYTLHLARDTRARRVAIWFDVPLDICLQRNDQRSNLTFGDEQVPKDVVRRMADLLQSPGRDEFDGVVKVSP